MTATATTIQDLTVLYDLLARPTVALPDRVNDHELSVFGRPDSAPVRQMPSSRLHVLLLFKSQPDGDSDVCTERG